ncbi:ABC transporter family protein, partial [Vibrio harveyi]
HQQR